MVIIYWRCIEKQFQQSQLPKNVKIKRKLFATPILVIRGGGFWLKWVSRPATPGCHPF